MQLENTTILPTNPALAKSILREHFEANDIISMVIFGNDIRAENAVEKADIRATAVIAEIKRKVIWMQEISLNPILFRIISDGTEFLVSDINIKSHIGISVSGNKVLKDIMPMDPEPDFVRIESSFILAGT